MAIISYLLFGAALVLSVSALWITLKGRFARIVDLLVNGPLVAQPLPVAVAGRGGASGARLRRIRPQSPRRAAA